VWATDRPAWFAEQVGAGGHVLATDIDTKWLDNGDTGAGLIEVQSDAFFPMGGPDCSELERATVEQVRDALIAAGIATESEIEHPTQRGKRPA